MGAVIIIGVLLLLVTHAGSKALTLEAEVKATNGQTNLPPNSTIPATGINPTPSPATALGSPTAAASAIVQLDTNSRFAMPNPTFYAAGLEQAGFAGVPLPMVPGHQWNGFNAVPARTKTLLTAAPAASTSSAVPTKGAAGPTSSGDVVYNPNAGQKL